MNTLDYIADKFQLNPTEESPIRLLYVGRDHLAQWLHDLDFKTGVEVGVAAGEYSEAICQSNPQMKLYGVDPWAPYRGYRDYTREKTFEKLYHDATTRLAKYPNYEFIKSFSTDALERFSDNSLDFVYIDANHTDPFITQDLEGWSHKVRPGGIVSGHDYAIDVQKAVIKYTLDKSITPWFILSADHSPSWMWIKP
jgi:hypothetical protein